MAKDKKAQVGSGKAYKYISSAPIEGATLVTNTDNAHRQNFADRDCTATRCGVAGTLGGLDAPPNMAGGSKKRYEELRRNPWQKPQEGEWDAVKGEGETVKKAQRKSAP